MDSENRRELEHAEITSKRQHQQQTSPCAHSRANQSPELLHLTSRKGSAAVTSPKPSNDPPTFGEQIEVIKDWWQTIREMFVQEFNRYEPNPANHKDLSRLTEVPLDKVYDFIIKKHIVQDRQMATKLVSQQIGMANLGTKDMMCYEEFNRLFCKGMFKVALINTIAKLTEESSSAAVVKPNRRDFPNEPKRLVGDQKVAQMDE